MGQRVKVYCIIPCDVTQQRPVVFFVFFPRRCFINARYPHGWLNNVFDYPVGQYIILEHAERLICLIWLCTLPATRASREMDRSFITWKNVRRKQKHYDRSRDPDSKARWTHVGPMWSRQVPRWAKMGQRSLLLI